MVETDTYENCYTLSRGASGDTDSCADVPDSGAQVDADLRGAEEVQVARVLAEIARLQVHLDADGDHVGHEENAGGSAGKIWDAVFGGGVRKCRVDSESEGVFVEIDRRGVGIAVHVGARDGYACIPHGLIAFIAGVAAERGYFDKFYKVFMLVPFYLLLSIPVSVITYILYEFQIGDTASAPVGMFLHAHGLPVLLSQILGDFAVEIPDKICPAFCPLIKTSAF